MTKLVPTINSFFTFVGLLKGNLVNVIQSSSLYIVNVFNVIVSLNFSKFYQNSRLGTLGKLRFNVRFARIASNVYLYRLFLFF